MKKFLIVNPFGIGDVLFTTPVISAIKSSYPDSIIGYWCNERVGEILRGNPKVGKVFAFSRGDFKKIYRKSRFQGVRRFLGLLSGIRKEHFDVALDFSLDHRYGLIEKLLGIKRRVGFNYKDRGRFLTDRIDIDGYTGVHVVEYYLRLLEFVGAEVKEKKLELPVIPAAAVKSRAVLRAHGVSDGDFLVGLAAGAGASWGQNASYKHWPAVKFAQLADRLIQELGAKVVILGDESERPIAEAITYSMKHKAIDLTGKTGLEDFLALVRDLSLLITNDGGPLHIAVAGSVPTVSIFGPVDEAVYGPYPPSARHIVVKSDIACRPCYRNFRMDVCAKERECLASIGVDEVFAAVRRLK